MPTYSFIRDEEGFTGPYTDLLAPVIGCIGVILFAYLLYASYAACASDAYYANIRGHLQATLESVVNDPVIARDGNPGTLDAGKMTFMNGSEGMTARYESMGTIYVVVSSDDMEWAFGVKGKGRSASAKAPVVVAFNDAVGRTGVMTLTIWEAPP